MRRTNPNDAPALRDAQHKMSLNFPNASRSYDGTRRAVRFWAHDTSLELSFFVTEGALRRMSGTPLADEENFLLAFDRHRDRICTAAARVYRRGLKDSYELDVGDF